MRTPTGTLVTAGALAAAVLVTGCGSESGKDTAASGEVFLQPVAAQGPDPFTDSTATSMATPPPVARTPQSTETSGEVRSYSGSTPGLYGGTERVGSCDVNRQIGYLAADRNKARAFADAAGISQAGIPEYLRGLAPVVLRADTRVTNHGYRDGRATGYQSVLQAGTAVLVDNRGVPRVRCACGNPLKPPVATQGSPATSGRAWAGYRPTQVVVVTPAPQVITNITIINVVNNTWIERRIWHEVHHDRPVPRPEPLKPTPPPSTPTPPPSTPTPTPSTPSPDDSLSPRDESTEPSDERTGPTTHEETPTDCVTPTVTVTPGATEDTPSDVPAPAGPADCPSETVTATPPTTDPQSPLVPTEEDTWTEPAVPDFGGTVPDGAGTESVVPDDDGGGGTVPDGAGTESVVPDDDGGGTVPDGAGTESVVPDDDGGGGTVPDGAGTEPAVPDDDGGGTVPDESETPLDPSDELGPQTVPDTPDVPDGGGLIPDDPEDRAASGSIFGSPTDVFDG